VRTIALAAALAVAGCNQLFGLDPIGGAEDDGGGSRRAATGRSDPGAGEQCDDGDTRARRRLRRRVPVRGRGGRVQRRRARRLRRGRRLAWDRRVRRAVGRARDRHGRPRRPQLRARAATTPVIADGCAAWPICAPSGWRPCQAADLGVAGRAPRPRGSGSPTAAAPARPSVVGCSVRCRRGSIGGLRAVRADPRGRLLR
jgi:hypothetical protein